jgi:hypothetical protein
MLVSVNADETITIPPTAGIDGAIDAGYGATILPTRTIWDDVYRPDTTEASGFVMRFRIAETTPLLAGVAPVASIESVADETRALRSDADHGCDVSGGGSFGISPRWHHHALSTGDDIYDHGTGGISAVIDAGRSHI